MDPSTPPPEPSTPPSAREPPQGAAASAIPSPSSPMGGPTSPTNSRRRFDMMMAAPPWMPHWLNTPQEQLQQEQLQREQLQREQLQQEQVAQILLELPSLLPHGDLNRELFNLNRNPRPGLPSSSSAADILLSFKGNR
tara:strand:+ start:672 stop:1085 length:414 start_codon:yes stop_codon:yes gene_type:complete